MVNLFIPHANFLCKPWNLSQIHHFCTRHMSKVIIYIYFFLWWDLWNIIFLLVCPWCCTSAVRKRSCVFLTLIIKFDLQRNRWIWVYLHERFGDIFSFSLYICGPSGRAVTFRSLFMRKRRPMRSPLAFLPLFFMSWFKDSVFRPTETLNLYANHPKPPSILHLHNIV